jgi:hypothetical protein
MSSETYVDPVTGTTSFLVNGSGIDNDTVISEIMKQAPEAAALMQWGNQISSRHGSLFSRDKFVTPAGVFGDLRAARYAVEHDDVVGNVIDTQEQIAINRVKVECEDMDEEDIWAQIIDDLELEQRMREMWREMAICSFMYPAVLMGNSNKEYKVKGKGRKKTFSGLTVPLGLTLLDPLKVVPVGNFMFGQEQLAYLADIGESQVIDSTLANTNSSDLVVKSLLTGKYEPTVYELDLLKQVTGQNFKGVGPDRTNLYVLDPKSVFRVTATRSSYERFPVIRMKSIFELLDLKAQLKEMDRAHLVGGTNFIVLVKKGTDERPAKQAEIDRLNAQVKMAARVPVIIGDHRLEIEIITPKNDKTLAPERYNTLDSRITARLYQLFLTGNNSAGTSSDDSLKLIRIVARSMESRRNIIRDAIMKHVIMPTFRANDQLKSEPKLKFYPGRISLDFDPNIAVFLQDLRDRGDISRSTILAWVDLSEEEEAAKREREAEHYDEIFSPVNVPFSGVAPQGGDVPDPVAEDGPGNTRGAGRRGGGTTGGGGTNRQSVRSGPPRGPASQEDAP